MEPSNNEKLNPYGFTVRLHEALRNPVKIQATLENSSIKDFVEKAVTDALECRCNCPGGVKDS